jgi:hypothetical protein
MLTAAATPTDVPSRPEFSIMWLLLLVQGASVEEVATELRRDGPESMIGLTVFSYYNVFYGISARH